MLFVQFIQTIANCIDTTVGNNIQIGLHVYVQKLLLITKHLIESYNRIGAMQIIINVR